MHASEWIWGVQLILFLASGLSCLLSRWCPLHTTHWAGSGLPVPLAPIKTPSADWDWMNSQQHRLFTRQSDYFLIFVKRYKVIIQVCMSCAGSGLEWGDASRQRSSPRQSGGEAAERQGSAPGSQDKAVIQFKNNNCTVQGLHVRSLSSSHCHLYLFSQVNSAFIRAVTQGAESVVDGFVEPMNGNPEDPAFLWGGLYMSQGATSAMFGGERGRRWEQSTNFYTCKAVCS